MAKLLLGLGAHSSRSFDDTKRDIIQLIEVAGPNSSRRSAVTERLIHNYIANDFQEPADDLAPAEESSVAPIETLKLFFSARQGPYNGDMLPIPLSQLLYDKLAPYARIPSIYPDVLFRKTAMHVFATPQVPSSTSSPSAGRIRNEYLSYFMQSIPGAARGICAGTSFTYHFPTRHMYVFMHSLADRSGATFCSYIEHGAAQATAFIIPCLLIQFNLEQRLKLLGEAHDDIYTFERRLGIRYDHKDDVDVAKIDYGGVSKGLNATTTDLAYMVWSCQTTARQLDFLDGVAEKYHQQAVGNGFAEDEADAIKQVLNENQAHLRCWNESLEQRTEYLSKRGQALVQTVYSGIAQRDAALSQNAAIASARDSAVMRVIAAITIVFLPATTTATFFSTTFFDFNVGRHERVYSRWLWLYWVVTLLLTAIVLVGAVMWWKRKEKEMARRIGKGKTPEPSGKLHTYEL